MSWNFNDLDSGIPAAYSSDEAKAWFLGFAMMGLVRLFRAGLRWFKRAGTERHD